MPIYSNIGLRDSYLAEIISLGFKDSYISGGILLYDPVILLSKFFQKVKWIFI